MRDGVRAARDIRELTCVMGFIFCAHQTAYVPCPAVYLTHCLVHQKAVTVCSHRHCALLFTYHIWFLSLLQITTFLPCEDKNISEEKSSAFKEVGTGYERSQVPDITFGRCNKTLAAAFVWPCIWCIRLRWSQIHPILRTLLTSDLRDSGTGKLHLTPLTL